jgi:ApbE superfamily uncharacterized protein (UPF0280 family)
MMQPRAAVRWLPDNRRLHLQDGPIDLIIEADGEPDDVRIAYEAAVRRFTTILDELCAELPLLRSAAREDSVRPNEAVARRMFAAVCPYSQRCFITPMAAVAGAVAEEILASMTAAANAERAYVNNGGDIALHLAAGKSFAIGMVDRPDHPSLFGTTKISSTDSIRGVATSGWRGRSFSLGIADAVTVLADGAAAADAAATVIANAVDLPGHGSIVRVPACEISPDSDLGERLVTRGVGELTAHEVEQALDAGEAVAGELRRQGLIRAAAMSLCEKRQVVSSLTENARFALPLRIAQHA